MKNLFWRRATASSFLPPGGGGWRWGGILTKSFLIGSGFALGLLAVVAVAVTVGTVKTWTSGETLTSSDLNSTIGSLKTALEAIPNWTKSGTSAVYTDGNVGIATTSPTFKLTIGSGTIGNVHPDHDLVVTKSAGSARMGAYVNNKGVSLWTGNDNTYGAIYAYDYGAGTGLPLLLNEFGGKVGIGTTNPAAKLDIVEQGAASAAIAVRSTAAGTNAAVSLQNAARNYSFSVNGQNTPNSLLIYDGTAGATRLSVNTSGNVFIGDGSNASYPLQMASGAYVTTGGVWTNASSREYKENLRDISAEEALAAVMALEPQKFSYKNERCSSRYSPHPNLPPQGGKGRILSSPSTGEDSGGGGCTPEQYVGFIAEDVPDLVATQDRKGLSAMDLVAVLTKVVQAQQSEIDSLRNDIEQLKSREK